jgi:hypothetical protein
MNRRRLSSAAVVALSSSFALGAHAQPTVVAQGDALHAQPTVVVHGDATCPSADMIRAALLVARPVGEWPDQTVTVEVAADRLALSLGEAPAARREIPADADCSVRAASVAVVVAAWSGDLASPPMDSPVLTAASAPPVLAPAQKPSHVIELDGSGFYSQVWGHAPGVWLSVGRTPRDGGAGVRVLGAYQSADSLALEGGTNQVQRFLVGAAATYRLQRTHIFASGDVGLVGTLTRAQGAGYQPSGAASAANFGGVADLRAGLRLGRVHLWANTRLLRLAHAEEVKVRSSSPGVADSAALNAWDVQLGMGVGFRFE